MILGFYQRYSKRESTMSNTVFAFIQKERERNNNDTINVIPAYEVRNYKRGMKLVHAVMQAIENSREQKLSTTHISNATTVCYSQIKLIIPEMIESGLLEIEEHSKYFGKKRQIKRLFKTTEKGKILMKKINELETLLPNLYSHPIGYYDSKQRNLHYTHH
jgi:predicted transcriptional regulator